MTACLTVPCRYGFLLLAATDRGVCALELGTAEAELQHRCREYMQRKAHPDPAQETMHTWLESILAFIENPGADLNVPLDLQGTAFQLQVWEALRETVPGQTLTYTELADRIDRPDAVRAVASACARNPLALIIPCHRAVNRQSGLSGYRWGIQHKAAILQYERIWSGLPVPVPLFAEH